MLSSRKIGGMIGKLVPNVSCLSVQTCSHGDASASRSKLHHKLPPGSCDKGNLDNTIPKMIQQKMPVYGGLLTSITFHYIPDGLTHSRIHQISKLLSWGYFTVHLALNPNIIFAVAPSIRCLGLVTAVP